MSSGNTIDFPQFFIISANARSFFARVGAQFSDGANSNDTGTLSLSMKKLILFTINVAISCATFLHLSLFNHSSNHRFITASSHQTSDIILKNVSKLLL
ncbi:MAG: hypothetical protein ACOZBL_04880 [Patescibacteria group bacterium]